MNISNRFLQKYYPTRKLYAWALALIYIAPISLLAAQQNEDKLTYDDFVTFIKEDLETLASKNNNDLINKTDLKSTWAKEKFDNNTPMSLKNLKDALKKDSESIIKAASKALIEKGNEIGFARKLNLLTESGIDLIKKKDFKLDGLTLEKLSKLYKQKYEGFSTSNVPDLEIVTKILAVQEKKVTDNIMNELKGDNKEGTAWEHLKTLLDYDKNKGIFALGLTHETIKIPIKLLINNYEKKSCKEFIKYWKYLYYLRNIFELIKKTLEEKPENEEEARKIWAFLKYFIVVRDVKIKDEKAENYLQAFTPQKCLEGVNNNSMLPVAKKIVEKNVPIAKKFVEQALPYLKTLKDKKSINAIWEILSSSSYNIEGAEKKLPEFNYHQLDPSWEKSSKWASNNNKKGAEIRELLKKNSGAAKQLVQNAFKDNNEKSVHFWELLHFLIADKDGPKIKSPKIAEQLVASAFKDNNQNSVHFWELLHFLIEDKDEPKIPLQKIDASKMTLEAALKGADTKPELLTKILQQNKDRNGDKVKTIMEEASKLLIEKGSKPYTRERLNILTKNIKLFPKEKFNLDGLTLEKLAGFYKKRIQSFGLDIDSLVYKEEYEYENNIDFITEVLTAQKGVVTKMIENGLQKGGEAWKRLQELLDYDNGKGIPALDLSYATIDLSFDFLFQHSNNMTCRYIIENISKEQPKKGLGFIEQALKKKDDEQKNWSFLYLVLTQLSDHELKSSKAKGAFKDFTINKCLKGWKLITSNDNMKHTVLIVSEKILKNFATAKRFGEGALGFLKSLNDNDDELRLYIWEILSKLVENHKDIKLELQELPYNRLPWNGKFQSTLKQLLLNNPNTAQQLANKAFTDNNQNSAHFWELLYFLIVDQNGPPAVDAQQITVQKFDEKVVFDAFSSQGNKKDVIESLLRSHPNQAKELVKEILSDQNLFSKQGTEELLHWLIFTSNTNNQGAIVPPANIHITIEAAVAIFHYLQSQPNQKLSEILNNVFRNNLLQGAAEKKVNDILNDDTELSNPANIELLHWLIFTSHTNNQQVAIVPPAKIDITPERAIEIFHYLQSQLNPKLSEILNSAIKTQPSIGKGMLEIAINGQTGSSLDWSNANVNFDLLHLLMLDPNGPQLTIERADVGNLDLPAIERHISKPNALQLFKKILHDPNNIDTFNAFRYAIFPSNSNSNNTFDYQNVDWDRTKWGSIPALKELIKPIDLPEDIVVKKLQDDGFTHKAIVKDIVLTSSSNLLEKVLNIAFPNVTVTSTTPTPTITWPQSLSATNWDIVASLTDSQHGIIKAKEVIQKVVPDISSSHLNFAKDYDLSSVRWGDFDWEAFEDLAEQSNIASFSIQNYLTIAENVLPGLQFVDQEPEVSQIDWDQIKSYKVVNFLIEKEIIPKKILINAPRSLLKQRINNISRLSLAEADFWKDAQEEKSKYYWSFAPYAVGLVLASAIALYVFNKQTKKQERKRGSHNKEDLKKAAKVKTQHNKDNKQHQKIIGNPIP